MKMNAQVHSAERKFRSRQRVRSTVHRWLRYGLLVVAGVAIPFGTAHAYVGPGLGLGTLIIILGVIGSALLAIFGMVWYPIKRMFKKRRASGQADERKSDDDPISKDDREATEP